MFHQPTVSGWRYIIPQRETVAGDALDYESVSKTIVISGDIGILSEFDRHKTLLSSRTVFISSIHSASTGPSKTNQSRSKACFLAHILKVLANIPSVQSLDIGSEKPYISWTVIDFGLITWYLALGSSTYLSRE